MTEFSENYSNIKEEEKEVWSAFDPEIDNEPTYIGCDFGFKKGKYGIQMFIQNEGNIEILKSWNCKSVYLETHIRQDINKMLKKTGKIKNKYNKPLLFWK